MKKYIFASILSLGILVSPVFSQAAALTDAQVQSILSLLSSFGAESTTIANVKVSLMGGTPSPTAPPASSGQMCSQDAMQCPDGSYVGRTGPRCEFKCSSSTTIPPLPPAPGVQPVFEHRVCKVMYRNLSQGTQGDDVRSLQEFLSAEGHLSTNATGYFGPMTVQAVAKWQGLQGVPSVGSVGPITRERIKAKCGLGVGMVIGGGEMGVVCTQEYAPVCGQPRYSCPEGRICAAVMPQPKTYSNRCMMNAEGAAFLRDRECQSTLL